MTEQDLCKASFSKLSRCRKTHMDCFLSFAPGHRMRMVSLSVSIWWSRRREGGCGCSSGRLDLELRANRVVTRDLAQFGLGHRHRARRGILQGTQRSLYKGGVAADQLTAGSHPGHQPWTRCQRRCIDPSTMTRVHTCGHSSSIKRYFWKRDVLPAHGRPLSDRKFVSGNTTPCRGRNGLREVLLLADS